MPVISNEEAEHADHCEREQIRVRVTTSTQPDESQGRHAHSAERQQLDERAIGNHR